MKTRAWQRSIGALLFLPIALSCLYNYGLTIWFLLSLLVYFLIALTITAGYHRYYSHASYECNKFWKFIYGYIGTASLNSSPVEWASVHMYHHNFSDTELDPYDSTWRQFFKFKSRTDIKAPRSLLKLLKSPLHRFWIRYSALVAIATASFLYLLDYNLFLFCYILPVTAYLFTSYSHNILAHIGKQPKNLWFLEFIVPMCGEWMHKLHHEQPKLKDFNIERKYFDIGGYFIRVINYDR